MSSRWALVPLLAEEHLRVVRGDVQFRILGPLEVWSGDAPVRLRGPRQERCLAALLLEPGRLVTFEALVDVTWGDPPPTARRQVQDLVSALRRTLVEHGGRDDLVTTQRSGYVLRVDATALDSLRFEELVAAARKAPSEDLDGSAAHLRSALALCRGPTLAGIASSALGPAVARWEEMRLTVQEDWLERELKLGNHLVVTSGLYGLASANPLRERPVALLMRALQATGRISEALAVYQSLRRRLADEVGLDPTADLQALHRSILAGKAGSVQERILAGPAAVSGPMPAQLPPDVRGFTGRAGELVRLDAVALRGDGRATAVVIAAVAGTAGIGKTALAVHWGHRVAGRFPDGQLYVNLRGFDAGGTVMQPAVALRGFLDALQVPPDRLPTSFDAQLGLYRSLLADRRMLIVLDNARDAEQVRPLLPGAPGCVVVITSRNQLAGVVAAEGAHSIVLGALTHSEARQLLAYRLGRRVVQEQSAAADDIITSCERLPLALAIVAAQAAMRTGFPLTDLAARLHETRGSLEAFTAGDANTDLRAVFSWSYDSLSAQTARMFRLLGLHPGPDIAVPAAASLAGVPASQARSLLAELAQVNLVAEKTLGRFSLHDLLRAYATELVHTVGDESDRDAATLRLLDHYLHTANAADRILLSDRRRLPLSPPQAGVLPEAFATEHDASTWSTAEHQALVSLIRRGAADGHPGHVWRLVWSIEHTWDLRGQWRELVEAGHSALRAADQVADRAGQGSAHNGLARAYGRLREFDRAHFHLQAALSLYRELGDLYRQSALIRNMGILRDLQGSSDEALRWAEQALEVLPADAPAGERAHALNVVGWFQAQLGHYETALAYCQRALDLKRAVGDMTRAGPIMDSLGYIYFHLDDHRQAIAWYTQALDRYRGSGISTLKAATLARLGDSYHALNRPDEAADAWSEALAILDQLDSSAADSLRNRLGRSGAPATTPTG